MDPRPSISSGLWFVGALIVVHVQAAQSDGRLGAWESEEYLDARLPLHVHRREDEQVVLLDGQITFWVGDRIHRLVPGQTLSLPRDVPHAHLVTSRKARILTVATPGGVEQLFMDLGIPALPGTTAPPPPDNAVLAKAAGRLGIQIVGPPA